ncbi:MAG: ribosomal RNA small subunit methyltransferase A [Planctomycetes bacterium]|nr:ribosomal RNA small subunit methyltransferase A [Planctomycetota bacterium]
MDANNADCRFQTMTTIRGLLAATGGFPKKRFGQCFLIDRNLMGKLVASAELHATDCVLEVGTGTGSLTGLLAAQCARVVTVEVDADVAAIAREQLADFDNIDFVETDALQSKSVLAPELVAALTRAISGAGGEMKLVANLPYDIATSLVVNMLLSDLPLSRLCFTVQAEVADRFLAAPDTNDYGPVTILTYLLAEGQRVCKLPPTAFWPAPKVHSAMVRLDVRPREAVAVQDLPGFSKFIHTFFNYRRKTIAHIARETGTYERLLSKLDELGISPTSRSENLAPEQWIAMFHAV